MEDSELFKIVFDYLDSENFITIETLNRIYIAYDEYDKFSQIVIDKIDGFCEINYQLVDIISSLFNLKRLLCWDIIVKWVSDREDIIIYDSWSAPDYLRTELIIKKI